MTRRAEPVSAVQTGETAGVLTVDLDALAANWRLLRDRMGRPEAGRACAAVVKADGYGLGAAPVARRLAAEGCATFFVAHAGEGVALREVLPEAEIFVLHGPLPGAAGLLARHRLAPCLNDTEQVRAWLEQCADAGPMPAALHVDTGMTRLGLDPEDLEALDLGAVNALPGLLLMSHLACADEPDHPLNCRQQAAFAGIRPRFPAARASLANSSGLFLGAGYQFDLGRPGYALYGGNPTPSAGANPMRPVARLQAPVLQVREIRERRTVGYGATAGTAPPARIATLAAGYADGYLRTASNRGSAFIDGHACPVTGRVSMDLLTVDVTEAMRKGSDIHPGVLMDLIDARHTIDDVAANAGTIGYEILTGLGSRYRRRYTGDVEAARPARGGG
ncbi:MAG: alanine racemase [Rhodospirillaceae bacterium]|nr:alanine racemase [Rhodospirillaceae bacterium]MYH36137.1 alanine racemase [Rhodospirillaceae bacterium]MYK14997.1 alanine racemase [Rhodospirillaceae bacterium]MYK57776.1 alanine racemase [Rhodospirillaceae bacterium]